MASKSKHRASGKKNAPAKQASPPAQPAAPAVDWQALIQKYSLPVLGILLLAGFLIRVLHLPDLSLWMDEYVHVMRAKNFLEGDGPLLTDDNNGILFTLSLLPGFAMFGPEVFWARFPSVLFGIGTIYLTYRMGTRLFNRYVGLLAAGGATFSLYLIFWSRVSRNYAILAFFFLLLGLVFLAATEQKAEPGAANFWRRNGFSVKHLLWLPVVALLSLLSHQLTFFFIFTVAVYTLGLGVKTLWDGTEKTGNTKYLWLGGALLPFLLIVLIPPLGGLLRDLLQPILLSNIADWAFPNFNRLGELWSANPLEAFDRYHNLLRYDLHWLYLPALLGLFVAFRLRARSAWWTLCSFAVPFMLLSFIYREPFLCRYLIFAYPYLLIAAAAFFYAVWEWLNRKAMPGMSQATGVFLLALPFILLLINTRWSSVGDLALARKLEGYIVDSRVASWSFTDWKEACTFVDGKRHKGDVIMSTVPTAVSYYLQRENVLWFRQAYYDTGSKKYKLNPPNPNGGPSAASFEDLVRTVEQNPRGWLLADYYLENIFTDERALLWVYQNMQYYPEGSKDGSVMVFGWDHSLPKPERQNLVVELGHYQNKIKSREYHMTLPQSLFEQAKINMTVRVQGVDSDREALVLFNGQNAVWIPANKSPQVEERVVPLNRSWIRPGSNTIQVLYEPERPSDPNKGFTVHFLSITGE
ncbi:MAG: glycosyltransferase family 39 protein [Saprospiraceae bacterium]|nr:glycosyltransferase family 39 protein [Saprospiraceae bacterium]